MAEEIDVNDPSIPSAAYTYMTPKWARASTLLEGTEAMRAARETYMPRHEHETDENYNERVGTAVLYNFFELTLDTLSSKPFVDPVSFTDETPDEIKEWMKDIDLQGNNIGVFAHNWFKEALAKGLCHCLIDMPALEEGVVRTREDDLNENRRPYWVNCPPESVIFIYEEQEGGETVLKQVRMVEEKKVLAGFQVVCEPRIRVLEPGSWKVYRPEQDKKKSDKPVWVLESEGTTSIDVIPLVTFYTDKRDTMISKPPLDDLAFLNIRHWQSNSDQINILTVARFPMLAVSGAMDFDNTAMAIGPRQMLGMRDPNGEFYYVEHDGAAIKSGREELMDLEDAMSSYGADFLKRRPGNSSATARALDSVQSISKLQDYAVRFQDALNQAMYLTALWMNMHKEKYGEMRIQTTFSDMSLADADLRTLAQARANRDISRETFIKEMQRRGHLSDDIDPDEEVKKILAEEDTLQGAVPIGMNVKTDPLKGGKVPGGGKNGE
jgi:hypothetical protein